MTDLNIPSNKLQKLLNHNSEYFSLIKDPCLKHCNNLSILLFYLSLLPGRSQLFTRRFEV